LKHSSGYVDSYLKRFVITFVSYIHVPTKSSRT